MIGQKRDGRREYDHEARDELVRLCLTPDVSVARTAIEYDINPNLLRTWVTQYQQRHADTKQPAPSVEGVVIDIPAAGSDVLPDVANAAAFIPVVHAAPASTSAGSMTLAVHVRLSNGVELEFGNPRRHSSCRL
ncbi:transposase [Paraburkholderia bannensis]|nr:transposase [Paraburkholderia bannensis]RQM44148.1 transposase [Paraburkholderia bannensis]